MAEVNPKHCPFCGGSNFLIGRDVKGSNAVHYVRCGDCRAEGPHILERNDSVMAQTAALADAIVMWNKRHVFT